MQICNPTVELTVTMGMSNKEAKSDMEKHPVTVETKIKNIKHNLKSYKSFCASY